MTPEQIAVLTATLASINETLGAINQSLIPGGVVDKMKEAGSAVISGVAGEAESLKKAAEQLPIEYAAFKATKDIMVETLGDVDKLAAKYTGLAALIVDPIQKSFGGLIDINNVTNQTTKSMLNLATEVEKTFLGPLSEIDPALKVNIRGQEEQRDALSRVFKSETEMREVHYGIIEHMMGRNLLKMNDMSAVEHQQMLTYTKGMNLTTEELATLMQEQIRRTGESNLDMLNEVSANAKAIADKTGQSYKIMTEGIRIVMTNVKAFGDIQVDEAARIASALDQLGTSYESFGSMVEKFMDFDQAASAISDLTSVFGVHLDTMEMMQLANEDEEAFLHRLRDSFDEQGIAMDDLSKAQRNMIASTLGMKETEIDQFFRPDELAFGMDELTAATDEADFTNVYQDMIDQAPVVVQSAETVDKAMQKNFMFSAVTIEQMETFRQDFNVTRDTIIQGYAELAKAAGESVDFTILESVTDFLMGEMKAITEIDVSELSEGGQDFINKWLEDLRKNSPESKEKFNWEINKITEDARPESVPKLFLPMVEGAKIAGEAWGAQLTESMASSILNLGTDDLSEFNEAIAKVKMDIPVQVVPEVKKAIDDAYKRVEELNSPVHNEIKDELARFNELLDGVKTIVTKVETAVSNIPPTIQAIPGNIDLNGDTLANFVIKYVNPRTGESVEAKNE